MQDEEFETPNERAQAIAEELVRDAVSRDGSPKFHVFRTDGFIATVRIELLPKFTIQEPGVFITAHPAGVKCTCCGGTGKTRGSAHFLKPERDATLMPPAVSDKL